MIQEQERNVWASLDFVFIYLIVLVCRKSCASTLQGGPGVRGAKGHRGDPGPKVQHFTVVRYTDSWFISAACKT